MILGDIMKIYVDADACPVIDIIENLSEKHQINCVLVSDHHHVIKSDICDVITVGFGFDAADLKIINMIDHHDILVTNDTGLASLALAKDVYIMNFYGDMYTKYNIDTLLTQRYLNQKIRNSNKRHKGPKKRTHLDDDMFSENFEILINDIDMEEKNEK